MTRLGNIGNKRTPKYRNVRCELDGIVFDSKAERKRYIELGLMKQAGAIKWFGRQPSFLLAGGVRYRPDFIVCDWDGVIYVEDVKGMQTAAFRIKQKLFEEAYPTIELRLVR